MANNELNQENKCAQLYNTELSPEFYAGNHLQLIFQMQNSLQLRLGQDFSKMPLDQRVELIKDNWTYLTTEFTELIERLPFKHWKKYTDAQKADFISDEQKLETWYEWCDMLHFFINIGLLLGIDHEKAFHLYYTKNKENFARQDRGY